MKTRRMALCGAGFALAAALGLGSCVTDERPLSQAHGVVRVEIAEREGAVTRSGDEVMNTVRLIVFTDLDTSSPRAEINRLYSADDGDFTLEPSVGGAPPRVRFTLKVERRADGPNEKLIVAVINEPPVREMTDALDAVAAPEDLEGVKFDMSHFVSPDHLSIEEGAAVPMTGALRSDRLFRTEGEASRNGNLLTLETQRAVARVDVYLKRGGDVAPDMQMVAGSTVKLHGTCTEGNLFYHTDGTNVIGSIPTVASGFVDRTWTHSGAAQAIDETRPVCVFYTPEREHTADRLRLDIALKTAEGATRSGSLVITRARDAGGVERAVDTILRNHIYKVTVTVGANDITADVIDWNDENLNTDL